MKTITLILAAAMPILFPIANAQQVVRETIISANGVVTEYSPDRLVVEGEAALARYTFTKTTQYLDEAGNPVQVETIRKGVPVTVHYIQEGPARVASKIVVYNSTSKVSGYSDINTTPVKPFETAGTVMELADGTIALRTDAKGEPLRYAYSKTTKWVDQDGNVVTSETVKSGTPITVVYTRRGERTEVAKIIVRNAAVLQPAIIEQKTTTTTTTTETK